MNQKHKAKNISDLKHSVLVSKGSTFLALAFSSWLGLFFGIKDILQNKFFIILIPTAAAAVLFYVAYGYFEQCKEVYSQIEDI